LPTLNLGTVFPACRANHSYKVRHALGQRRDAFFFNKMQAGNPTPTEMKNGQSNPRGGGQDDRHRQQIMRIKNANAGRGEAGDTDLQKPA